MLFQFFHLSLTLSPGRQPGQLYDVLSWRLMFNDLTWRRLLGMDGCSFEAICCHFVVPCSSPFKTLAPSRHLQRPPSVFSLQNKHLEWVSVLSIDDTFSGQATRPPKYDIWNPSPLGVGNQAVLTHSLLWIFYSRQLQFCRVRPPTYVFAKCVFQQKDCQLERGSPPTCVWNSCFFKLP